MKNKTPTRLEQERFYSVCSFDNKHSTWTLSSHQQQQAFARECKHKYTLAHVYTLLILFLSCNLERGTCGITSESQREGG